MKKQLLQPDYTTFGKVYQVKISSEYEVLIPRDESVRLLDAIMEELDYTKMYRAYAGKGHVRRSQGRYGVSAVFVAREEEGKSRGYFDGNGVQHQQIAQQNSSKPNRFAVV